MKAVCGILALLVLHVPETVLAQTTLWPDGATIYLTVETPDAQMDMKVWSDEVWPARYLTEAEIQQTILLYLRNSLQTWSNICQLNLTFTFENGGTTVNINRPYRIFVATNNGGEIFYGEMALPVASGSNIVASGTINGWPSIVTYEFVSDEDIRTTVSGPPYTSIDLKTVIFHEAGHAIGIPHIAPNTTIYRPTDEPAMQAEYHGSRRTLTAHDRDRLREAYNSITSCPPHIHTYVKNSFSGGVVNVVYSHDHNLDGNKTVPSGGYYHLDWPENSAPTVTAIDPQTDNGVVNRYDFWEDQDRQHIAEWEDDDWSITFSNSDNGKTFTCVFRPQLDVTLAQPQFCTGVPTSCTYKVISDAETPSSVISYVASPGLVHYVRYRTNEFIVEALPISGGTFIQWSDGVAQNPRNLTPNSNITLYAIYSQHLASDHTVSFQESESATSTNNQRKIAFVGGANGMHHQVYESCDHIFYCNSTDLGQSWSSEVLLSNVASTDVEKPSIYADADSVWVAWSEGSGLRLVKFPPSDPTSIMPYAVSSLQAPRDDFTPVLVRMDYAGASVVLLVYEALNAGTVRWALFVDGYYHSQGDVYSSLHVPNYIQVSPSIVRYSENEFELVWRDGPDVWYRAGRIESDQSNYWLSWVGDAEMVPLGNRPAVGAPTISHANQNLDGSIYSAIACETGSAAPYGVSLTFRKLGAWWHVQTFIIANEVGRLWAPSISMLDEQAIWTGFEHLRFANNYTDDFESGVPTTRQVWAIQPEFDQYGNLTDYPVEIQGMDALHPSVVTRPPTGGNLSIFTGLTGGSMNTIENRYDGLNKTQSIDWHRSRELSLRTDTTVMTFGLANLRTVDGTNETLIDWYRPVDSSVVGIDITVEDDFRTGTFYVNSGTRLKYTVLDTKRGLNQMPPLMHLGLEVRDANSNALLGTLGALIPNSIQNGKRVADMNINLTGYSGHTVYVRVTLTGQDSTVSLHAQDIWSVHALNSANFPKDWDVRSDLSDASPSAEGVTLDQNYPNPFNPATTISYAIPEKLLVTLTVHDILGRVVETLVDREMPSGPHSMTFDATNLPSGLYLYRLTAGGSTLSRSMTVVK